MTDWTPDLTATGKPRYLAIADSIAADIAAGRLTAGDRLPPQRALAQRLGMDFTTIARGYVEAQKRGLVDARVGQGTFVRAAAAASAPPARRRASEPVDLTMNLPPEVDDPELLARMAGGIEALRADLVPLLRYQGFGGQPADKAAAGLWLARRGLAPAADRLFITPGAHAALMAILTQLAKPGDTILCEALTYPGLRALAAQLSLTLVGLPMDAAGIDPQAFRAAATRLKPKALYLTPTLQNPTTRTVPPARRADIVAVARDLGVPLIEDDAYGFIPPDGPLPLAALAPDLTWYVASLAKCLGAGLRCAYVVAPEARAAWPFAATMRATTVMASPLTVALATHWIEDGTGDALLSHQSREWLGRGLPCRRNPAWRSSGWRRSRRLRRVAASPPTPSPPRHKRPKRCGCASADRSAGMPCAVPLPSCPMP
ncbi:MAG: GntR family transcriptional regulator [Rhizobiales bacterium 32-66-8]|nr:MAG: GntR family transcriptional regulator [Rhizobiales bacterium 32-66-8]